MPGRKYSSSTAYRYGFNGKENDKETVSTGDGTQDYGFRIYNPSLGRFLSTDPLFRKYAYLTPYAFAENDVIRSVDLDGLEKNVVNQFRDANGKITKIRIHTVKDNEGKVLDQHLVLNGTDYSGTNVLVIDHDSKGNRTYNSKTKFNRIQKKINDNKTLTKTSTNTDEKGNFVHARDDNPEGHDIRNGNLEVTESNIKTEEFEYSGSMKNKGWKNFVSNILNKGTNPTGKEENKTIDEYQIQGKNRANDKKSLDPSLSTDTKEKENSSGVPEKGDSKVITRTYEPEK
jgi:RHS repeat-associated protein